MMFLFRGMKRRPNHLYERSVFYSVALVEFMREWGVKVADAFLGEYTETECF
jgi:hypothetical protein